VIGIPLGYLLDVLLIWLVKQIANVQLVLAFPPANLAIALAGIVLLALLVTLVPIRRAVRYRPGDALRYA